MSDIFKFQARTVNPDIYVTRQAEQQYKPSQTSQKKATTDEERKISQRNIYIKEHGFLTRDEYLQALNKAIERGDDVAHWKSELSRTQSMTEAEWNQKQYEGIDRYLESKEKIAQTKQSLADRYAYEKKYAQDTSSGYTVEGIPISKGIAEKLQASGWESPEQADVRMQSGIGVSSGVAQKMAGKVERDSSGRFVSTEEQAYDDRKKITIGQYYNPETGMIETKTYSESQEKVTPDAFGWLNKVSQSSITSDTRFIGFNPQAFGTSMLTSTATKPQGLVFKDTTPITPSMQPAKELQKNWLLRYKEELEKPPRGGWSLMDVAEAPMKTLYSLPSGMAHQVGSILATPQEAWTVWRAGGSPENYIRTKTGGFAREMVEQAKTNPASFLTSFAVQSLLFEGIGRGIRPAKTLKSGKLEIGEAKTLIDIKDVEMNIQRGTITTTGKTFSEGKYIGILDDSGRFIAQSLETPIMTQRGMPIASYDISTGIQRLTVPVKSPFFMRGSEVFKVFEEPRIAHGMATPKVEIYGNMFIPSEQGTFTFGMKTFRTSTGRGMGFSVYQNIIEMDIGQLNTKLELGKAISVSKKVIEKGMPEPLISDITTKIPLKTKEVEMWNGEIIKKDLTAKPMKPFIDLEIAKPIQKSYQQYTSRLTLKSFKPSGMTVTLFGAINKSQIKLMEEETIYRTPYQSLDIGTITGQQQLIGEMQMFKQSQMLGSGQMLKQNQILEQGQFQKQIIGQKQVQTEKQQQKYLQKQMYALQSIQLTSQGMKTPERTRIRIPFPSAGGTSKTRKQTKKGYGKPLLSGEEGYELFVKKRGKFKGMGLFTKERALDIGAYETRESASAQFKLVPTDIKVRDMKGTGYFQAHRGVFREYRIEHGKRIETPLTFIQKRGERISTRGEKREITYRGKRWL